MKPTILNRVQRKFIHRTLLKEAISMLTVSDIRRLKKILDLNSYNESDKIFINELREEFIERPKYKNGKRI